MIAYVNGEFKADDKAALSISDLGILRGYGAFDFLRTYKGVPFHLRDHLKRLSFSLKEIGLSFDHSYEKVKEIIAKLIKLNHLDEASIKILVTGGESLDHIFSEKESLVIMAYPLTVYSRSLFRDGIKVITHACQRFMPQCKSLNYTSALLALKRARKKKAKEALYVNERGEILEATTSNFFAFQGDVLVTPEREILYGITREIILRLTKNFFRIEKRRIHKDETFTEAFITASNKQVMPVTEIDDVPVGDGKVGKNTKKVMQLFQSYVKKGKWEDLFMDFCKKSSHNGAFVN